MLLLYPINLVSGLYFKVKFKHFISSVNNLSKENVYLLSDTCECHEFGSNSRLCDAFTFQCDCKLGVVGKTCDQCKLGWYGLRFIQTAGTDGCLRKCNNSV